MCQFVCCILPNRLCSALEIEPILPKQFEVLRKHPRLFFAATVAAAQLKWCLATADILLLSEVLLVLNDRGFRHH